jgi:hypothetical protein
MKNILFVLAIVLVGFISCDKVENPIPVVPFSGGIDWSLYPDGDSTHYVDVANAWPTFVANSNTDRNVLLEDFTGHKCNSCPAAAVEAESIAETNYPRVIISSVHSGPNGAGALQSWSAGHDDFYHDFTSVEGSEMGEYFGQINFSGFFGNPRGLISRVPYNGEFTVGPGNWGQATNDLLVANDLKVNLQSETNYYPSTRGLFLHTEVDIIDASLNVDDLKIVAQLHQDSIIRPQDIGGAIDENYVHRDILIGCLDQFAFGRTLSSDYLDANGKYYYDYSYKLPTEFNKDNMHLIIYVRDAVTEEVYQVIKQSL